MIWRSPYPDIDIPDISLAECILSRAERMGEKAALIDGVSGRVITYADLIHSVRHVAAALSERGFRQGDVLAVYSPNCPEYAIVLYAVALLGGTSTTVNPLYTADELARQLADAGSSFLFTIPPLLVRAREAAEHAGVHKIIVLGDAEGTIPLSSLLTFQSEPPRVPIDSREEIAVLPYSSGTTGLNKGVMLSHRNLVANLYQLEDLKAIGENDILLGLLPFYHIYGMVCILHGALFHGATLVTLPRFDLEQFLATIQQYRITAMHLVPPIILALAKHALVDQYDLSSVGSIFSGAAPLGEDLSLACQRRIGCTIYQGYGLTETSPVTHFNRSGRDAASVGPCLPNTESKVVDATGIELGIGQLGELCVRGPQIMKGYLNNPESTAATIDRDGWLHTGDLGYSDGNGAFVIVDRLKELIKYKGLQVAPAELEGVLLSHPLVADSAVIRVPDEEAGEVPKAFVVLKGEIAPEELLRYVAERVAPYKKIRYIEVVEEIPKATSGKILRRVLMDREISIVRSGKDTSGAEGASHSGPRARHSSV